MTVGRTASLIASVIVPAYNAAESLQQCLAALFDQSIAKDQYETIVVDDGSTDNTPEVARSFGVILVQQPNQGPAAARNAGARVAKGDVLLFTDSDCAPTHNWLKKMLAPFVDPEIAAAKGSYRTGQKEWIPRLVQVEYEEKYHRMAREKYIDFVDTYSAAYRRDVFIASGGFDTAFPVPSAEDQEFSFRLASAGHKMVFVPEAVVFHRHPSTWTRYLERKYRFGYWRVLVHWRHPKKLLKDSHTLQVQKVQMLLAAGLLAGIGASIVEKGAILLSVVSLGAFVVSSIAFAKRAAKTDSALALYALPFLFLRAFGLLAGVVSGLLTLPFRMMARSVRPAEGDTQPRQDSSPPVPGPHQRP